MAQKELIVTYFEAELRTVPWTLLTMEDYPFATLSVTLSNVSWDERFSFRYNSYVKLLPSSEPNVPVLVLIIVLYVTKQILLYYYHYNAIYFRQVTWPCPLYGVGPYFSLTAPYT